MGLTNSSKSQKVSFASCGLALLLLLSGPDVTAQAAGPDHISFYDGTGFKGTVELSGHSTYDWWLVFNGRGDFLVFVNGFPITGQYWDLRGGYRWVFLDLYGAHFLCHVDISQLHQRGPRIVIDYFSDDYGNWVSGSDLWEDI